MASSADTRLLEKLMTCPSGNPWAVEGVGHGDDGSTEAVKAPYVRHRYAYLSAQLDQESDTADSAVQRPGKQEKPATMSEFDAEARRIFLQYVPALERPQLPLRYRDFIARNRVKSSMVRRRILRGLQRYDLAGTLGANAQFNREVPSITDDKLRQIELEADAE